MLCRVTTKESAVSQSPGDEEAEDSDELYLQNFLGWLVNNGVTGIGTEESKIALFSSEGGERGVICVSGIRKGETVFEVPLRLALTDHPGDEESNKLLYEGAPWSVRLAAKLLRQAAKGAESPWSPYIQVLPDHVPAPLVSFSWEELAAISYAPAQNALHEASWLATSAYRAASEVEAAIGGVDSQSFDWALSVVHSRTFASAAPGGGIGVRMLVPLVDMLNHGGDEARGPGGIAKGDKVATDNVRWDLVSPTTSGASGWVMRVSATRDIPPGAQLLLSYGERANDDFFIHYGFVPPANPHDEAVLFNDLEEALEWHYAALGRHQVSDEEEARVLYSDALDAARLELDTEIVALTRGGSGSGSTARSGSAPPSSSGSAASTSESAPAVLAADNSTNASSSSASGWEGRSASSATATAAALAALASAGSSVVAGAESLASSSSSNSDAGSESSNSDSSSSSSSGGATLASRVADLPDEALKGLTRMKVAAGGRVSGPLITAFASVSSGDVSRAEAAVALRCAQLLGGFGRSLLENLALLAVDSDPQLLAQLQGGQQQQQQQQQHHYVAEPGSDTVYYLCQLQHYHSAIVTKFPKLLRATCAAQPQETTACTTITASAGQTGNAAPTGAPATAAPTLSARFKAKPPAMKASNSASQGAVATGSATSPLWLLQRYNTASLLQGLRNGSAGGVISELHSDGSEQGQQQGSGAVVFSGPSGSLLAESASPSPLVSDAQRLTLQFCMYKKMLMWDLLLLAGSGVCEEDLLVAATSGRTQTTA